MTTFTDRLAGVSGVLGVKAPVRAATTEPITLSGLQTIDGVTVAADDRVLVKNQASATENGVYVVSSGAWARAKDFDGANDVSRGTQVFVSSGATNGGRAFYITTAAPVIGTSIEFAEFGDYLVTLESFGATTVTPTGYTADSLADHLGAIYDKLGLGRPTEILMPQDFGAGTDKTAAANATAFQAWKDALETRRYGAGYIPAGRYLLNESAVYAVAGASTGLSITGGGRDVTVLEFTATTSGNGLAIEVDPSPAQDGLAGVVLDGFTVVCAVAGGASGAGIVINGTLAASDIEGGPIIRDVAVRAKSNTQHWAKGIVVSNWGRSIITGCEISGPQPGAFAPSNMIGVGIEINFPGDHKLTDVHVHTVDKALLVAGETEGVFCSNCTFVAVNYGLHWEADGVEPLLEWSGGHINAYRRCIYTENVRQIVIRGGLMYHFLIGTPAGDWRGIHLKDGRTATITGTLFEIEGSASLDQDAVLLDNFDYATVSIAATNGDGVTRGNGAGVRVANGCRDASIDCLVEGWSRGVLIEAGANRSIKITGTYSDNGVHVLAGASESARTVGLNISDCVFGDATETLVYLDSVAAAVVAGNVATKSSDAPASGDYVLAATNAAGGSYQFDSNQWPGDAPSIAASGVILRGTDERGSPCVARGSATVSSGGSIAIDTGLVANVRVKSVTPTNATMGAGTWYAAASGKTLTVTAPNGSTFDWEARV